jgi:hypothetical protein
MTKKTKNIAASSILLGSLLTTGALGYSLYEFQNANVVQNNSEIAVRVNDPIDEKEVINNTNTKAQQEANGGRGVFIIMLVSLIIGGLIIANIMILLLYSNYGKRSRTFIEQNVNGKILKEEITVAIEEYKQRRDIVDTKVETNKDKKESKDKTKSKKSDNDKVVKTKKVDENNELGDEKIESNDDNVKSLKEKDSKKDKESKKDKKEKDKKEKDSKKDKDKKEKDSKKDKDKNESKK